MTQATEQPPVTSHGSDGDACEHMWMLSPAAEFRWVQGNCRCRSVSRWMMHCANCGTVKTVDDLDAPQPC